MQTCVRTPETVGLPGPVQEAGGGAGGEGVCWGQAQRPHQGLSQGWEATYALGSMRRWMQDENFWEESLYSSPQGAKLEEIRK